MNHISRKTPALFLDRDGIVIHDSGYAKDATNVALLPDIASLIRRANSAGWKVMVVTNQSGLGRGWIRLEEYEAVSDRMLQLLGAEGARVDQIYFAPFHEPVDHAPTHLQAPSVSHHGIEERGLWSQGWRKPMPGMLLCGARDHGIDLSRSLMVGDRATDQVAGFLAGVKQTYLYQSSLLDTENRELENLRPRLPALLEQARLWQESQTDLVGIPLPIVDLATFRPLEIASFSQVVIS